MTPRRGATVQFEYSLYSSIDPLAPGDVLMTDRASAFRVLSVMKHSDGSFGTTVFDVEAVKLGRCNGLEDLGPLPRRILGLGWFRDGYLKRGSQI